MRSWLKRLFGRPKSYAEITVQNTYEAIVLCAGPAAGSENHIGSEALGIPENMLTDFIVKRFYLHEAFLFVAFSVAETSEHDTDQPSQPLTVEMAKKLQSEWVCREGQQPTFEEIGGRCFDTVESLSNDPAAWSREWLREFFAEWNPDEETVARWAQQCMKELVALRRLAVNYAK